MAADAPEPLGVQVDDLGSGLWGGRVKQVRGDPRTGQGRLLRTAGWTDRHHPAIAILPPVCLPPAAAAATDRRPLPLPHAIEACVPLRNALFSLSRAAVAVEELPIR